MRIITLTILGIAICWASVSACTCVQQPPARAFKWATAVFVGEVIEITEGDYVVEVRFKVERSYKGVKRQQIMVTTSRNSEGECGFKFDKGRNYLVYAYGKREMLDTDMCTRTRALDDAQEDLAVIEKQTRRRRTIKN